MFVGFNWGTELGVFACITHSTYDTCMLRIMLYAIHAVCLHAWILSIHMLLEFNLWGQVFHRGHGSRMVHVCGLVFMHLQHDVKRMILFICNARRGVS